MSISFESVNGTTYLFDGTTGISQAELLTGLVTQPNELIVDQRVGADGGVLVARRKGPKRLLLTALVSGDTAADKMSAWAGLCAGLDAGGELVFDGANGVRRLRNVLLEDPSRSEDDFNDNYFTCSLIALDPWWYGPVDSVSGSFDSPTAWNAAIPWDSAIPWNGGASVDVVNAGDAPAACTVVVEGPATSASFSVNGMGGWESEASVSAGEYLSVSSEPDRRGPHRGPHGLFAGADGPIDWSLLTESSQLFELPAGVSSLVFGASGTSGASAWTLQYSPRFLTP